MIPRSAAKTLRQLATYSPVVAITGARQSGKTTLARAIFADRPYFNLEDPELRDFAEHDPLAFMQKCRGGAVIDEAQRVPKLFSYIQVAVDEQKQPGQYILTGSSQFLLNEKISQSLAGRVAYLHLMPLSYAELRQAKLAPQELNTLLFSGGYPPVYDRTAPPHLWYRDYIATYTERDLRQLIHIQELGTFQRFLTILAGYTGQLVNYSKIGADAGISANTVKSWLHALEMSYVTLRLMPHHKNFRKRLVKQPKLYFHDTGLLCRLLRIEHAEQLDHHPLRGALFENWVTTEILKHRMNQGLDPNLYFWRSQRGLEIDLLLDFGTSLHAIECKSGQTIANDWFKPLQQWQSLAGETPTQRSLIYGGNRDETRHGVQVHPWQHIERAFL